MSYRSDLVDISIVLVHQTEKAVLVDAGLDEPVWLPRSIIEIEQDSNGKTWTITLPEYIAKQKGLI